MSNLTLRQLVKTFGGTEVLHSIDLDIEPGEFVVLVGPSGCGKSTTLRLIAGLEEVTSGTIEIAGRVVNNLEPKDRDIAMVFQNYAIYPHMTVRKNIGFGLRSSKMPRADKDKRIDEIADAEVGQGQVSRMRAKAPRSSVSACAIRARRASRRSARRVDAAR